MKNLAEMTRSSEKRVTKLTDCSTLDGFSQVEEYAEYSKKVNQQYLCVTDHGTMSVIPRQIRACEVAGLQPIFGIELYLNDKHIPKDEMVDLSPEERAEIGKNYHLLCLAYNEQGYSNLVQLSSLTWLQFYKKPRATYAQIDKHKEGVIFTSSCYIGEIGQAFDRYGPDKAEEVLKRYIDWFSPHFYLEIMLLDFKKQRAYDEWLVKMHAKYGTDILLSQDCHVCKKEDSQRQRYMLMIRSKKTIHDFQNMEDGQEYFELTDGNLYMKSEGELDEKYWKREMDGFSYSDIIPYELYLRAKRTTVEVARKASGVEIDRSLKLPQIPDADHKLKDAALAGYKWRGIGMNNKYINRLKEELDLICKLGFSSYFIIQQEIIQEARRICPQILGWGNGDEAIGPGRGCVTPDTKIVLSDGSCKSICEIEIGDLVITRDGTHHPVEKVLVYDCDEVLLNVKTYYGEGVTLTKDHKILTADLKWVPASEVKEGDWLFVPKSVDSPKDNYRAIDVKVRSIEEVKYKGKVYDLTVKDNHNYLTSCFLIHNSCVGSLVCYCLGITDVDPIKHDLLFSRFLSESRGGREMKTRFTEIFDED